MSFANTIGHSVNSGKTYISTDNFSGAFYTYTVAETASLDMFGTLTTVATSGNASSSLFARGHHLALNGRKLTPGINPMNAITGNNTGTGLQRNPFVYGSVPGQATVTLSPSGASATTQTSSSSIFSPKFMVGVMDIQTGLNGFIDPTNSIFALYDKNRPVSDYLIDMAVGLTATNARGLVNSGQGNRINATRIAVGDITTATPVSLGESSCGTLTMAQILTSTTSSTYTFTSLIVSQNSVIILTPRSDLKIAQTITIPSVSVPATGLTSSPITVSISGNVVGGGGGTVSGTVVGGGGGSVSGAVVGAPTGRAAGSGTGANGFGYISIGSVQGVADVGGNFGSISGQLRDAGNNIATGDVIGGGGFFSANVVGGGGGTFSANVVGGGGGTFSGSDTETVTITGTAQTTSQTISVPLTAVYHVANVIAGSFQIIIDTEGANVAITPSFNFLIIN